MKKRFLYTTILFLLLFGLFYVTTNKENSTYLGMETDEYIPENVIK